MMLQEGVDMDINSVPGLAPGCRLHPTQDVLLVPEGTLNLSGPSRDILARLDGKRTVIAVVDDLLQGYSGADEAEVRRDVLELLERLEQRGVVRIRE
jgi:pyrroloquinoline quinone biosynthesis protein D